MNHISSNIHEVKKRINQSALKAGLSHENVLLVAVTKTRSAEEINKAIELGVTDIGENKVQEIMDKYDQIMSAKWHMIGHLQTNKVKYIIDKVKMIHSLDSLKLAREINKRAEQNNLIMDVLVQLNVAEEESKFGIEIDELNTFLNQLQVFDHIMVKGLMTVAPFSENPEDVRQYFKKMKQLFDTNKSTPLRNVQMQYLSMGMTNDFEIAIEEGANIVRVGTAIFGPRYYK